MTEGGLLQPFSTLPENMITGCKNRYLQKSLLSGGPAKLPTVYAQQMANT